MERKKPGPKPKGDRRPIIARLPRALADAAQERAFQQGMTFNDYLGELLAAEVGVQYYPAEEALPLQKSA